jgi:hypothetical protein
MTCDEARRIAANIGSPNIAKLSGLAAVVRGPPGKRTIVGNQT